MKFLSSPPLKTLSLKGRKILVRTDWNVPLEKGKVTDTTRLVRSLETLRYLRQQGAQIIVLSHLGRPKGNVRPELSLQPVVAALQTLVPDLQFIFCPFFRGQEAAAFMKTVDKTQIVVLENLRFAPGEEANDPDFVQGLAQLGDFYINDGFSVSHRPHGSIVGIPAYLPCTAGLLFDEEVQALRQILEKPARPLMAVVAGAKMSTKLLLLKNLLAKVDILAIGGAMANTFLKAQGISIGGSLHENSFLGTAQEMMAEAAQHHKHLLLPIDGVVAEALAPDQKTRLVSLDCDDKNPLRPCESIFDVGPKTVELWASFLESSQTLVWNGPLGAFEVPPFHTSTHGFALRVILLTQQKKLRSVVGGGDTLAALQKEGGSLKDFTYASISGGAFLEWLEGKSLPGLAALEKAYLSGALK